MIDRRGTRRQSACAHAALVTHDFSKQVLLPTDAGTSRGRLEPGDYYAFRVRLQPESYRLQISVRDVQKQSNLGMSVIWRSDRRRYLVMVTEVFSPLWPQRRLAFSIGCA